MYSTTIVSFLAAVAATTMMIPSMLVAATATNDASTRMEDNQNNVYANSDMIPTNFSITFSLVMDHDVNFTASQIAMIEQAVLRSSNQIHDPRMLRLESTTLKQVTHGKILVAGLDEDEKDDEDQGRGNKNRQLRRGRQPIVYNWIWALGNLIAQGGRCNLCPNDDEATGSATMYELDSKNKNKNPMESLARTILDEQAMLAQKSPLPHHKQWETAFCDMLGNLADFRSSKDCSLLISTHTGDHVPEAFVANIPLVSSPSAVTTHFFDEEPKSE